MSLKQAVIYWIRLPEHTDSKTDGYLGVSNNLPRRLQGHLREIKANKHKNFHLVNAVAKYGWENLIKEVILNGEEAYCYEIEEQLRPCKSIGWNIAPGGHKGSGWVKGRKKSPASIEKMVIAMKPKNEEKKKATVEKRRLRLLEREQKKRAKEQEILLQKQLKQEAKMQRQEEKTKRELERCSESHRRKLLGIGIFGPSNLKQRPFCKICNERVCAVNYKKAGVTHYRSICDECGRKKSKEKPKTPNWVKSGYKKKEQCDSCGFKALLLSQTVVYHIDGNLKNISLNNLRTICLNCVEIVKRKQPTWKRGDLLVDY